MTNAEKYLKDGVDVEELTHAILKYNQESKNCTFYENMRRFWNSEVKPTLSEDEKVILKNVNTKQYSMIGRKLGGALYLGDENCGIDSGFDDFFENVFDWIEEGEEYKISDLLGDE